MNNIFNLPSPLPNKEIFESIVSADNILIERIISTGRRYSAVKRRSEARLALGRETRPSFLALLRLRQSTLPGEWYDQDTDEWVILLQGEAILSYADGSETNLTPGDYLFIPAHQKHRVEYSY